MRKNIEYLGTNGPTPSTAFEADARTYTIGPADKIAGVRVFKLTSATKTKVGGMITPVYYLDEFHSETEVLHTFLRANPKLVETVARQSLHRMIGGHGSTWRNVAPDVTEQYYTESTPVSMA